MKTILETARSPVFAVTHIIARPSQAPTMRCVGNAVEQQMGMIISFCKRRTGNIKKGRTSRPFEKRRLSR
ncbi:hypothetical protein JL39_14735 [Rhizobium sp. YS-1r]|nr:hypothetical protein JL39_14735 [Rhizobium sp. YS-1r]